MKEGNNAPDWKQTASFYRGKSVFVTGHTGFKGAWLCKLLSLLGAEVTGYALPPLDGRNLFQILNVETQTHSIFGDIRDLEQFKKAMRSARPQVVFHLAAQSLVSGGYKAPADTYATNVMGTVNLLESVRAVSSVRSVVNITTDKVYYNREQQSGYVETDPLDGNDPYANSKSCSELVTNCYRRSFLEAGGVSVSTARAGNVIGGGDFAPNRIVPDCVRAAEKKEVVSLRNPSSIRPYQFVLEPLRAYLLIAQMQFENPSLASAYNIGPQEEDCVTTEELARLFCDAWGEGASYVSQQVQLFHEAGELRLDSEKFRTVLGCDPVYGIREGLRQTAAWYREYLEGADMNEITETQIRQYIAANGYKK